MMGNANSLICAQCCGWMSAQAAPASPPAEAPGVQGVLGPGAALEWLSVLKGCGRVASLPPWLGGEYKP